MIQPPDVLQTYESLIGAVPEGLWFGPGRVNLIGEHTDYNDGLVLPFAIAQRAVVAAGRRSDDLLMLHSVQLDDTVSVSLSELAPFAPGWSSYVAGVFWALAQGGHPIGGANLVLSSDVPLGAGLSSSAAIECATVAALCDLFDLDIAPMDRAKLARKAENEYVGAPTGLLDQAASTLCTRENLLFLDCRSLEAELVDFPLAEQGLEILVLDTHTPHSHVDGEYKNRRAACEQAAAELGLAALRDVTDLEGALAQLHDPVLVKRVRHIVTENERVLETVALARAGKLREVGPLMSASHASMRDDYEITVPTVDLAVKVAMAEGSLGARMTGGGFGGCIISLCEAGDSERIGLAISRAFAQAGYNSPSWFTATAQPGAGRLA